jgi:hypothetical protein
MNRLLTITIAVIGALLMVSCGQMSVGVGYGDRDYWRPRRYFSVDPYYLYDGYWHDGYCYYDDGWYYHGYDTPYYYLYDPYDPYYW